VYTILLLTEDSLTERDATRIAALHENETVQAHVLVAADTKHNRLVEALDEVALGKLREALDDSEDATPEQAEQEAMRAVNATIEVLREVGIEAQGFITGDDPVPAAVEAAGRHGVDEVVVVTPPHIVEEALHRDWSWRLRDGLDLPLLHFVAGTDRVVG
jgi:hypothetical protein